MTQLHVTLFDNMELPDAMIQEAHETGHAPASRPARLPQDMRTALRNATAAAHEGLHGNKAFADLLRGDLARRHYVDLLLRLFGLHAALERKLVPHLRSPWFVWYDAPAEEHRSARLRRDLVALGASPSLITAAAAADDVLPILTTPEAALGCAWVVEGSALGGRLLARHVASIIGEGEDSAGSFVQSNPEQPARWTACCDAVNLCGMDPGRRAAILSAASATFEAMGTWLGSA
jgi:heme oxygenase